MYWRTKIERNVVTEVVSRVAKAPKEAIHVFINDTEGTYYPHGEMKEKLIIIAVRYQVA